MKTTFITLATLISLAFGQTALSAELIENEEYQSYILDLDGSKAVTLRVFSDSYVAARPQSMLTIKSLKSDTYVVVLESLYYTMEAIYPPLPRKKMVDEVSTLIRAPRNYQTIRVLIPTHLNHSVTDLNLRPDPIGPICMAYWTGYTYNAATDSCLKIGASGCSNPFEFTTLAACEAANL